MSYSPHCLQCCLQCHPFPQTGGRLKSCFLDRVKQGCCELRDIRQELKGEVLSWKLSASFTFWRLNPQAFFVARVSKGLHFSWAETGRFCSGKSDPPNWKDLRIETSPSAWLLSFKLSELPVSFLVPSKLKCEQLAKDHLTSEERLSQEEQR